jgi:2-polyprenyl-3-methyl-5-hydroxy-6-metoxy-1,4-benzoquinol methylase
MINWLHSRVYRPESGWDPVPASHVAEYAQMQWEQGVRQDLLEDLDKWVGGLEGKTVLDLGGGPGHYSIAFARRGARVTWYDISRRYRDVVQSQVAEAGVHVTPVVGYLDEAPRVLGQAFDLVFNRICWNYGRGDRSFSSVVWALVAPGGVAYVDTTPDTFKYETLSATQRFQIWMNRKLCLKVGHPFPPRGRIGKLFARFPARRMLIDSSLPFNDRVFVQKPVVQS